MIDWVSLVRPHCVLSGWQLFGLVLGNAGIAAVYLRIPWVLRRIVRRLGGAVFGGGIIRRGARFVQACAMTHLAAIIALFMPTLDLAVLVVLLYANIVSWHFDFLVRAAEDVIVETILEARKLSITVARSE